MEALLSSHYEEGLIRLARPLAPGVRSVPLNDPAFSDLAGVLAGVKPVSYTGCSPDRLPALLRLCEKLKLHCLPAEEYAGRRGFHLRRGAEVYFIGRSAATLRRAARAWADPADDDAWSVYLGYPDCCIKAFRKWRDAQDKGPDLVELAAGNTAAAGPLDFRLNNVFNYSSRVHHALAADKARYRRFTRLNSGRVYPSLHAIGWHPCSYTCSRSLAKAAAIYSLVSRHAPGFAAALRAALARPVLFWDKYRFAFLDGLRRPKVSGPASLLEASALKAIEAAEELRAAGGRARFFGGGGELIRLKARPPLLLDFTGGPPRP